MTNQKVEYLISCHLRQRAAEAPQRRMKNMLPFRRKAAEEEPIREADIADAALCQSERFLH